MKFEFTKVSDAVLSAFNAYQRQTDLIQRKDNLLKTIIKSHNTNIESILFLGFDPWILGDWSDQDIYVGMITHNVARFLDEQGVQYTRVFDEELASVLPVDLTVAADEFFTYSSDNEQRELVILLAELSNDMFITTLRDYKNLTAQTRDFSTPTVIKNDDDFSVYQEYHNYEYKVKDRWTSFIYENGKESVQYGPFNRQPMYFKQLAKFSYDAGADDFNVHKDEMFKSLLKKNYEHIITVIFK